MPLVLVQNPVIVNDAYDWKDLEGEQYHFPNAIRIDVDTTRLSVIVNIIKFNS